MKRTRGESAAAGILTKAAQWRKAVAPMVAAMALASGIPIAQAQSTNIFSINKMWHYNQTANLDGVNWTASSYKDSSWPTGAGLFYSETNALVSPRNTLLTLGRNTYYFRTCFQMTNYTPHMVLTFSNKVDDGAIFYLNGKEIHRMRVSRAPAIIYYSTGATSEPASGDATEWDVFRIAATNAINGENVLAVEVHQIWPDSDDIVFGAALSLNTNSVIRGPYLQLGTSTSIVIRWRTALATNSFLRFGTNVGNLDWQLSSATITNDHELTLSNLTANTTYFYAVGASGGIWTGGNTNYYFITAPPPGSPKPTRTWVLGDSGTADDKARALRDAYYSFTANQHTDAIVMLGDNAYLWGDDEEYQPAVFDMFGDILRHTVLWPCLGNHDTAIRTDFVDTYPFFKIFTLPTNGTAGGVASGTEHWYSFDYGNIHFICLDSVTANRATNGPMANWLRNDLNVTTQTWKIAYFHHPPYSKGSHNSDTETEMVQMRQNFGPILEKGGVDLVLAGHSHSYERSFLIDGHYGTSSTLIGTMILNTNRGQLTDSGGPYVKSASAPKTNQGAVYLVMGSSGSVAGGSLNHPAMLYSANALGSVVLETSGDQLTAGFLRETGIVQDEFTIVKRDPHFSSAHFVPGGFQLTLTNLASRKTNIIEAGSGLTNWISMSTNVVQSNSFRFIDTQPTNARKFYRMRRLP